MDTGRKDAAPRGGDADKGSSGSTFRSENNFGTSADVPGAPQSGSGSGSNSGADGGGSGGGSDAGDGAGSVNIDPAASLDTGDPSAGGGYALLIVIVIGGVLLGVAAARTRVSNSR